MRGTRVDSGVPGSKAQTPWLEMVGVRSIVELCVVYQDGMII